MSKLKLVAWSDSPICNSGFGRVAREVLKNLYATGKYDITSIGINYKGITPTIPENNPSESDYDKLSAYTNYINIPAGIGKDGNPFGFKVLIDYLTNNKVDILWMLQDTFNMVGMADQINALKKEKGFKVVTYFPLDTERFPDFFLDVYNFADEVVLYNESSRKVVEKMRGSKVAEKSNVIYHGYSPKDFYTISEDEIKEFRESFFGGKVKDTDILILQSDTNSQRKMFYKTLQIVGKVAQNDSRVKLYVNTKVANEDFQLYYLAQQCGLTPGVNFLYHLVEKDKNALSQDTLNRLYNSADIGISAVTGEGCGLFHYEMMSLGKTLLIADNSAHTEAVNAKAVFGIDSGTNESLWITLPNDLSAQRPIVDVEDGVNKLEMLVKGVVDLRENINSEEAIKITKQNKLALEFMSDKTWEGVGKDWVKLFEKVEKTSYNKVKEIEPDNSITDEDRELFTKLLGKYIEKAQTKFVQKTGRKAPEIKFN